MNGNRILRLIQEFEREHEGQFGAWDRSVFVEDVAVLVAEIKKLVNEE